MEWFLCRWDMQIGGATNVFFRASEVKEQLRKHKDRMSESLLQIFFWENSSKPLSSSNPISFSFLFVALWGKGGQIDKEIHCKKERNKGPNQQLNSFNVTFLGNYNTI